MASSLGRPIRFVGLSTALANAHDLADWLGCPSSGLFNFKPSVRPVPLEAHMQGYPGAFMGLGPSELPFSNLETIYELPLIIKHDANVR